MNDADWAAHDHLQALAWEETLAKSGREMDASPLADFTRSKRAKTPAAKYWLAYPDGTPGAFFSSWSGENGVGIVEDLFTQKEFRRRGIATALIAHSVNAARAGGATSVIIGADAADTPKAMYAAMGFRPMMLTQSYLRMLE